MSCPYLEEVVMVFCTAYPVRKLVPRNRMASISPCMGGGFGQCPLFAEGQARLAAATGQAGESDEPGPGGAAMNAEVGGGR